MPSPITRHPLALEDEQEISAPSGAVMILAAFLDGALCAWVRGDSGQPSTGMTVKIVANGVPVGPTAYQFLATVKDGSGPDLHVLYYPV